jgi:hypothetical protein
MHSNLFELISWDYSHFCVSTQMQLELPLLLKPKRSIGHYCIVHLCSLSTCHALSGHSKPVMCEGVSKSFRTGRLERELQMVPLSATRCSCIAILWVSLASFAAITLCVASQRVFIVVIVYFVIDSVRKFLDKPS